MVSAGFEKGLGRTQGKEEELQGILGLEANQQGMCLKLGYFSHKN